MTSLLRQLSRKTIQRSFLITTPKILHTSNPLWEQTKTDSVPVAASSTKSQLLISDSCIKRLREICQDGSFLRITVEGGGCSGFQYKFDLDNKMNDDDIAFGEDKAKVVVDNISLDYCAGSTVDYHTELIRAGFRIVGNPKAQNGCSCGASFAIKLD